MANKYNRLKGSRGVAPVLLVRLPRKVLVVLKRKAKARKLKPSALAREILEKALKA